MALRSFSTIGTGLIVGLTLLAFEQAGPGVSAQSPFDLKATRELFAKMQDGPYVYLQTPRTGLGVGTVYTIVDKTTWFIRRPESCFVPSRLEKASKGDKLTPAQFGSIATKTGWELGLKVAAAGPVTEDVVAEFKRKGVNSSVISIPSLTRQMMTIDDFKQALKTDVDLECQADMMRKSPERWIILETLTADDYSIKFEGGGATDASIAVGILKVLFPKFKFGTENEFKGELKFAGEPHIVAVKAVRIKDAVKFAGSGELPEVVNPLEYYKVVDSRQ